MQKQTLVYALSIATLIAFTLSANAYLIVNGALSQTGQTPTSSATPNEQIVAEKTFDALVAQRLSTLSMQSTIDSLVYPYMTQTAANMSGAPGSLDGTEQPLSLDELVLQRITATAQYNVAQTATAQMEGTVQAELSHVLTLTAQPIQATLTSGLQPLTMANVAQINLLSRLQGHNQAVTGVAFSPDGTLLASSSDDNSVGIWDVRSGMLVNLLSGLSDRSSVAFSPNGAYIAASSSDTVLRVWSASNGAELHAYRGALKGLKAVTFSPDSTQVVSGSVDKLVRVYDITRSGLNVTTLQGHTGEVDAVAYSPDGTLLASGGGDGQVILWDAQGYGRIATLPGGGIIDRLTFSPDGKLLAVASQDGFVRLWSVQNRTLIVAIPAHSGRVMGLAFTPDSAVLASCGTDELVRMWKSADGTALGTLARLPDIPMDIAFSPDGTRLAVASKDDTITLWAVK